MFERFTDPARRVVVLAQEEARMLNHDYIGTEHILLGLVHQGEGVAARALESLDIALETVREQVEEIIGQGVTAPAGHIPFTPRAKEVLELSLREALRMGHNYIGTEHILLGLIREGEGVAAQILARLGADLGDVRRRTVELLPGHEPGEAGEVEQGSRRAETRIRMLSASVGESGERFRGRLPVLDRLDDGALRALLVARGEARRLGHRELAPEHLLVGLLAEGGEAAALLTRAGVTPGGLRAAMDDLARDDPAGGGPPPDDPTWGDRPPGDPAGEDPAAPLPPSPPPLGGDARLVLTAVLLRPVPADTTSVLEAVLTRSNAARLAVRAAGGDLAGLRARLAAPRVQDPLPGS